MKIALVVPGGVDESGEERVVPAVLALIKRLSQRHEVHVIALAQERAPRVWNLHGARIQNIGIGSTCTRAMRAIIREHAVSAFSVVHSIWSGIPGVVAVAAARYLRVPSIVHVAGGELVSMRDIAYGGRLNWRGRCREAVVLRAAAAITTASDPTVNMLSSLGIQATRVPLGVDLGIWPVREPIPRTAGSAARLIHVASLNRIKDQPTMLRALAHLARDGIDFRLDVVGEDTLQGQVQREAQALGLRERLSFHGFLRQAQLRPLVESAQLMVISSRHEVGPLAVLEAAVAGVPTVGTAVGHICEWAPRAALSAPVGDSAALAHQIGLLLKNEAHRLSVAHEALRLATREDADYTAAAFEHLYSRLTAGKY